MIRLYKYRIAEKRQLIIYPNPIAENIFTIENTPKGAVINISNIQGVQLITQKAELGKTQIDVSSLGKGICLVQVGGKVIKLVRE